MTGTTDTDGILDRCADCGARARFVRREWTEGRLGFADYSVECTECGNAIGAMEYRHDAMVAWNIEQRKRKQKGRKG